MLHWPHPILAKKAVVAFLKGLHCEQMSRRTEARAEFTKAAEYCRRLRQPAMEALATVHLARLDRDEGNIHQALSLMTKVEVLLSTVRYTPTRLCVENHHQNTWGTICLKQPLAAALHEARLHFEHAIEACDMLLLILRGQPRVGRSLGLFVPSDLRALESGIEHDKAIMQINIAEVIIQQHRRATNQEEIPETRRNTDAEIAADMARAVLRYGKEQRDFRLEGSGHRILGEVALLKASSTQFGSQGPEEQWWQEMGRAREHLGRALALYGRSPLSTPQVVAAVENDLRFVELSLSQQKWIREGRRDMYLDVDRVPEQIVFRDFPWLCDVEQQARELPLEARWNKYFLAALRWEDAGWRDRCFECLVRSAEALLHIRNNLPLLGSFVSEQRADLMTKGTQIFDMLMEYLLSPEVRVHLPVSNPDAEAFRYREIFGPSGLLDEMELAGAVSEATSQHPDSVPQLAGPSSTVGTPCDVKALQEVLPLGTILIEYVVTDRVLSALVVKKADLAAIPLPLVTSAELRERVEKFIKAIGHERSDISGRLTGSGLPDEPRLEVVRELAQWLYDVLLRPAEAIWRTFEHALAKRIVIVPHRLLHGIPFCALFDGTRFMSEIVPITQCPSASIFRALCAKRSGTDSPITYFGLANPRGEEDAAWSLSDLLGCETVVLSASNQLAPDCKWAGNVITRGGDLLALRRQSASREAFFENAPHYQIVDLETHGSWNASWASHAFLAGAENGQPEWVTAREMIAQGRRMKAELLVAGICLGGAVEMPLGEEVLGLLRAFLTAGCRSILLYPWLLVDSAAELFMREWYQRLIERDDDGKPHFCIDKDVALQKVQATFIKAGREGARHTNAAGISASLEHPYYWAWTLVGDYASPVSGAST